jgi:hypothetical protein
MVELHITAGGSPLSVEGAILLATMFFTFGSSTKRTWILSKESEMLTCIRIQVKYDDLLACCTWNIIPARVADTRALEVIG